MWAHVETCSETDSRRDIKFTSCLRPASAQFDEIANLIKQGKPAVGCFPVDEDFRNVVYIYNQSKLRTGEQIYSHYVLFIGYGYDEDEVPYLVFLSSYGTNWGAIGFGPVYFSDAYKDWFYIRKVKAPKEKNNKTISSNFAHESSEEVEHPRQRRTQDNVTGLTRIT